ncbi:hypothetical protein EBR25_07505 [bacterium]|nr:hypothetical protein [bacterium]
MDSSIKTAIGIERTDDQQVHVVTPDQERLPVKQDEYIDLIVPARTQIAQFKDIDGNLHSTSYAPDPKNVRVEIKGEQVIISNTPKALDPDQEHTKEMQDALNRERLICVTRFEQNESGVASVNLSEKLHRKISER